MLNEFDISCLQVISDDYEDIPQIKIMLRDLLGVEASSVEITSSLQKLVSTRLARAYKYEDSTSRFSEVEFSVQMAQSLDDQCAWNPGMDTSSRIWFWVSQDGKDLVRRIQAM